MMGTHTDFNGAIRITPQIGEPLATSLLSWLEIRHMKRNVAELEKLYPGMAERQEHTLFGDGNFGRDGEFYLPEKTRELPIRITKESTFSEGLMGTLAMSTTPGSCPSLYSDLALVNSPDGTCSYLGWNGAEKAYEISEWIKLLASFLVPRGYHLDGAIFAQVEYGISFYYIRVHDTDVQVEDFEPESTYHVEFQDLYDCY